MPEVPTHVFIQSGVGGIAATVAGHLAIEFGNARPIFTVVDPERAACLLETARAGTPVVVAHGMPTIMAMLECYEPSLVAWRILSRVADGFMTVDEADAVYVMNQSRQSRVRRPADRGGRKRWGRACRSAEGSGRSFHQGRPVA